MKKEVAYRVDEALSMNGIDTEIYEDYSGRGMFGNKTTGVVIYEARQADVQIALIENDYMFDGEYVGVEMFNKDSMGLGWIIY